MLWAPEGAKVIENFHQADYHWSILFSPLFFFLGRCRVYHPLGPLFAQYSGEFFSSRGGETHPAPCFFVRLPSLSPLFALVLMGDSLSDYAKRRYPRYIFPSDVPSPHPLYY